jgi:hypothetical protein
MEEPKAGDDVQFKSAKLFMTVERVVNNYCWCSWTDGPHRRGFLFPHHILTKVIKTDKMKSTTTE